MDKVKLHAQERLDLDDTRSLQSLVYEYVSEALGGLMGHAHGVYAPPNYFVSEGQGLVLLYFDPFTFLTTTPSERGSTGAPTSRTFTTANGTGATEYTQFKSISVVYDSAEETPAYIDITNIRANFANIVAQHGEQYIWARPIYVDTNNSTRRKWDVSTGAEVTVSVETQEAQRVAFLIQNTEPAWDAQQGEARWARLGEITSFTNGNAVGSKPNVQWYSVFDDPLIEELLDESSNDITLRSFFNQNTTFPVDGQNKAYRTFSLPLVLALIRSEIRRIKGVTSWNFQSGPSLNSLYVSLVSTEASLSSRLTDLENRQVSPAQCIASCTIGVKVEDVQSQRFSAQYVGNSVGIDRTYTGLIAGQGYAQNNVYIKLSTETLSQSWGIVHISAIQHETRAPSAGTTDVHYDYNRVTFMCSEDATAEPNNTSSLIRIEFLPQVIVSTNHPQSENEFHPPLGVIGSTDQPTVVLRDLNTDPTSTAHDLLFSVAVFAVPTADLDN